MKTKYIDMVQRWWWGRWFNRLGQEVRKCPGPLTGIIWKIVWFT